MSTQKENQVLVIVTDTVQGRIMATKIMSRTDAINFSAVWNLQHIDSDCELELKELIS